MTQSVKFANFVILCAIGLVGSILIYEIFNYQLRIGNPRAILYYYGLPSTVLLLLVSLRRMRDDLKVNLTLSMISVATTLYFIELGIFFLEPATDDIVAMRNARAEASGISFDRRTKLELVQDLRLENQDVWLSFFPGSHLNFRFEANNQEVFPLGGISHSVTVLCNELGEYTTYTSDEHGFHNPLGLYTPNTLDIVAVGDSFTQGACVPSQKNAIEHIRNFYPMTLNLGMSSNGPLLELASFIEFVEPLKPKVILWFYYDGNDIEDLMVERKNKLLKNYLQPNTKQNLAIIQPGVDETLKNFILTAEKISEDETKIANKPSIIKTIILSRLRERLNLRFKSDHALFYKQENDPPLDLTYTLFWQILEMANTKTSSWNGQLYFIYLPEHANFAQPNYVNPHRQQVIQTVHQLGIPLIDVYEAFHTYPDPLSLFPFRLEGHYNETGYQLVSETVLTTLNQDRLLTITGAP